MTTARIDAAADRVVLVLCDRFDPVGPWALAGLHRRGLLAVLATGDEIAGAARFGELVDDDGVRLRVRLDGTRRWTHATVRGVLNRLRLIPAPPGAVSEQDSDYARNELNAIALSWLSALAARVPFVGTPSPGGLSGPWRSEAQWALLAHAAGLATAPVQFGTRPMTPPPPARTIAVLTCVSGTVLGPPGIAREVEAGLVRLAALADADVLRVHLQSDGTVTGFDILPDLRADGERALDVLAGALGAVRAGAA